MEKVEPYYTLYVCTVIWNALRRGLQQYGFFREKWFFPTIFPVLISHAYLFLNGSMFCYFEARKMWLYLSPMVWEDYKLSNDRLNIDWNDNSLYTSTKRNVFFCPQNDHVTTESSLEFDSSYFSNPVESVSSSLSMN